MSKALQAPTHQRLVANCSKNRKNTNNSAQVGLGIDAAASAVSRPPEALNRPVSGDSQAKARLAKERLIKAADGLKQDWLDADIWRVLAAQRQYRLPHWYIPLSAGGIERVLRRLGLDSKFFKAVFGKHETYGKFLRRNPTMPLWAFAGMCLETSVTEVS